MNGSCEHSHIHERQAAIVPCMLHVLLYIIVYHEPSRYLNLVKCRHTMQTSKQRTVWLVCRSHQLNLLVEGKMGERKECTKGEGSMKRRR